MLRLSYHQKSGSHFTVNNYYIYAAMNATLKAIIVDDEENARDILKRLLKIAEPAVEVIDECGSIQDAYTSITKNHPDILFLDVQMPGGDGFELLRQFKTIGFKVIFVTSYDQYAIQAFRYSAVDYLLKPIDIKDLKDALSRLAISNPVRHEQATEQTLYLLNNIGIPEEKNRFIALQQKDRVRFVKLSDIICLEADRNYSRIYTVDGGVFLHSKTLKHFEDLFVTNKRFFRATKAYIINLDYVKEYTKSEPCFLYLINNKEIEIGRRKKTELLELLR